MSLSSAIAALASRIGIEVKSKIDADHPGVARAWVSFGYVNGEVVIAAAYNVASVVRTAVGRYRIHFAVVLPDASYCWTAIARSSTNSGTQRIACLGSIARTHQRFQPGFGTHRGVRAEKAQRRVIKTFLIRPDHGLHEGGLVNRAP